MPRRPPLLPLVLLASAGACSNGTPHTTPPPPPPVAAIAVAPASASIQVGATTQLTATPKDASGGTLNGVDVTWNSADPAIAAVSSNGLVTGLSPGGPLPISATAQGITGTATITVTPPPVASVMLTPATASIVVGGTTTLIATLKDAQGRPLTGRTLTWSSSDPAVAAVSAAGVVTGVAVGGPITITATSEGKQGTATVTVTPIPVAQVAVTPPTGNLFVGATVALTATPKDAQGGTLSGRTITWASGNPALATVSASGVVTGVAPGGPVTITATCEGISGTATVTVSLVPVATVTVSPGTGTVPKGTTLQLTATLKDAQGQSLTGRSISWSSSANGTATVSATGLVTGVAMGGPVTITATSEGISGTAMITVDRPLFGPGWHQRRPLNIVAGSEAVPSGYSVGVTFDHAALVAAGKSLANGDDVRIAHWTGTQWEDLDRVLDTGSNWGTTGTMIWFKLQVGLPAQGSDGNYFLYYGNSAATLPPANAAMVFLVDEDWESGTFAKWDHEEPITYSIVSDRVHRGTKAVTHMAEGPGDAEMYAKNLDVADVYVDAWWQINALSNGWNVAQGLREWDGTRYYSLLCLCIGASLGWNVAEYSDDYYDLALPAGSPTAGTWMRVGTAMSGTTYRLYYNGTPVRTVPGLTKLTHGTVGIYKWIIPPGLQVWIDDIRARRFVYPEPTVTGAPEETLPSGG